MASTKRHKFVNNTISKYIVIIKFQTLLFISNLNH